MVYQAGSGQPAAVSVSVTVRRSPSRSSCFAGFTTTAERGPPSPAVRCPVVTPSALSRRPFTAASVQQLAADSEPGGRDLSRMPEKFGRATTWKGAPAPADRGTSTAGR
ncbi:hypothetical protein Pen02_65170 [Plantactinospora endophytica]|uniref:Uncharacterized protein n=1 Tax=Plantactinospora endophytica TaxID=673535 RepID=A0ABQ4EA86_9ACTN|nr:hypothetical protein Pen02_65170 [Plantactinospora endophytica]